MLSKMTFWKKKKNDILVEFPGGLVVRNPRFHCRGPEFNLWLGN